MYVLGHIGTNVNERNVIKNRIWKRGLLLSAGKPVRINVPISRNNPRILIMYARYFDVRV